MTLLGMMPMRSFSSIKPAVFDNTIFMPEMYPAKLVVPYKTGEHYQFTMHRNETIEAFKEKVLASCPDEIKSFDLIPGATDEATTTGDLKTRKFQMKVNNKTYSVYPDLRSMVYRPWQFTQRKGFEKLNRMDSTTAIGRQVVLAEYYEDFYKALKAEAGSENGNLTKKQIDQVFKKSLKAYKDGSSQEYSDAKVALAEIKEDLAKL